MLDEGLKVLVFLDALRGYYSFVEAFDCDVSLALLAKAGYSMSYKLVCACSAYLLNGESIDFNSYRLFNGPFLRAEIGSGKLEMRYNEMKISLDFNAP